MEREALGPVKAQCLSVGECQGGEAGVDGWVGEHPHRSKGRGYTMGGWAHPPHRPRARAKREGACVGETGKGDNV